MAEVKGGRNCSARWCQSMQLSELLPAMVIIGGEAGQECHFGGEGLPEAT